MIVLDTIRQVNLRFEREWNRWADRRVIQEPHPVSLTLVWNETKPKTGKLTAFSGYVAVAVSTAQRTYIREVETGDDDREKNDCLRYDKFGAAERSFAEMI